MESGSRLRADSLANSGPGTYALILRLLRRQTIQIGRLGQFDFAAGYYAYAGSALGLGGLSARLRHHLRTAARPHWHIDYLRQAATIEEIWFLEAANRLEHAWATLLGAMPGATISIPRFGASDCACVSHLFYFRRLPALGDFQSRAAHRLPGHERLQRLPVVTAK